MHATFQGSKGRIKAEADIGRGASGRVAAVVAIRRDLSAELPKEQQAVKGGVVIELSAAEARAVAEQLLALAEYDEQYAKRFYGPQVEQIIVGRQHKIGEKF